MLLQTLCYDTFMKTLGIIAEYNPLHNGHIYQMEKCREMAQADNIVVIMSGNFTQRGEAAVLDKWTRARLAVENGADLVLELPFAYAVNSAEYFARGGVRILNALGCVTHLGFGAEAESLEQLQKIASETAEESPEFQALLQQYLADGVTYAKAREQATTELLGEEAAEHVQTPNNILAIEYLKQLHLCGSEIEPVMVTRKGAGYHSEVAEGGFASATAIRNTLDESERKAYVPENVDKALAAAPSHENYFHLIQSKILGSTPEQLAQVFSMSEGLENRMLDQIRRSGTLDEFVDNVKSKRYPETRIRRILCQMLMGLTDFEDEFYVRLLAASSKGTALLKKIKKESDIQIITNINKEEHLPELIKYDILASDIYNVVTRADLYKKSDYVVHPFIQKG